MTSVASSDRGSFDRRLVAAVVASVRRGRSRGGELRGDSTRGAARRGGSERGAGRFAELGFAARRWRHRGDSTRGDSVRGDSVRGCGGGPRRSVRDCTARRGRRLAHRRALGMSKRLIA